MCAAPLDDDWSAEMLNGIFSPDPDVPEPVPSYEPNDVHTARPAIATVQVLHITVYTLYYDSDKCMVIKTVSKLSYINITCINLRRHSSSTLEELTEVRQHTLMMSITKALILIHQTFQPCSWPSA